ncbi:MAG TPA: hypothetical protein PK109_02905 [Candidatus Paceibacterota bacterium]|nr:hypothetical protein [Candidatus Paceibacterota bacterium]
MKKLSFVTLLLALVWLPAYAAQLSIETPLAGAGDPFSLPVVLTPEGVTLNVVEGVIQVPDGVVVDRINTAGSAFSLFMTGPSYVPASHAIEFTLGAPGGVSTNEPMLLFVIEGHAQVPGSYPFKGTVTGYENDGVGTALAIAVAPATLSVGPEGSVHVDPLPESAPTSLIAEVGRDASLFEGKWFATFFGGMSGSSVDHYAVREGWWRAEVPADRYYVLQDQSRSSTLWVTAVGENGKRVTVAVAPENPWMERLLAAAIILTLGIIASLVWRRMKRS